jgi:ribosomal protein S13
MTDPAYLRFLTNGSAERIIEALSDQQHLQPRQTVGEALDAIVVKLGICPAAAREAVESLQIEPTRSIGRLRRTELMQLARTIHRFWRQSVVQSSGQSQPA